MPTIQLKSSDEEFFFIDEEAAQLSGYIQSVLEVSEEDNVLIVFLPIRSAILRKVLQWADYHKNDLVPIMDVCVAENDSDSDEPQTDNISPWDADFLKNEAENLMELGEAAVFLDMKELRELACKTIANIIKNSKSVEEIRQTLKVENDFTPAEEEQIRRENDFLGKM